MKIKETLRHCSCGSGLTYELCCGRFLDQDEIPEHAEGLMRSRYTAYTLNREDYLLDTWHPGTRPTTLNLANELQNKWLGLTVKRCKQSIPDKAVVEFVARYKINGRAHRMHEISRFVREDGRWFYVDGDVIQGVK